VGWAASYDGFQTLFNYSGAQQQHQHQQQHRQAQQQHPTSKQLKLVELPIVYKYLANVFSTSQIHTQWHPLFGTPFS